MTIKIVSNDKGNPPGKLADAELHFTDGPLEGLKLIGFASGSGKTGGRPQRHVPGAQYCGQRRAPQSSRCCGPSTDSTAQNRMRDLILEAYEEHCAPAIARIAWRGDQR